MRKPVYRLAAVVGGLALSAASGPASAQYGAYDPCNPCPPVACQQCAVPVAQTCYQTVPVTEYQEVRQTVQRPVCDVEYVDQEVTEYRPITEQRTASVPTVNYEDVTEYQCVQKDMGCWRQWQECVYKPSPCEYDNRPGVLGWFNRTSYSMRAAMMPSTVTRRQWVPNVVQAQVPITRRVARHGTREVAYNVTRMEPYTTTRKVAVNKVRYVAEEVTRQVPVTVYRTVPTGTSIAWAVAPFGPGATATALAPGGTRSALAPRPDARASARADETPIRPRTATRLDDRNNPIESGASGDEPFRRDSSATDPLRESSRDAEGLPRRVQPSTYVQPAPEPAEPTDRDVTVRQRRDGFRPTNKFRAASAPSIVRAVRPTPADAEAGPALPSPASIAAADTGR